MVDRFVFKLWFDYLFSFVFLGKICDIFYFLIFFQGVVGLDIMLMKYIQYVFYKLCYRQYLCYYYDNVFYYLKLYNVFVQQQECNLS